MRARRRSGADASSAHHLESEPLRGRPVARAVDAEHHGAVLAGPQRLSLDAAVERDLRVALRQLAHEQPGAREAGAALPAPALARLETVLALLHASASAL